MRSRGPRRVSAFLLVAWVIAVLVAGCGNSGDDDPDVLTVWNLDSQPDRMAALAEINADFTEQTGVSVELVAVQPSQLPSLIASAAVSDTLPDLVNGLPLGYVRQFQDQELLDTDTATELVQTLDPATFTERSLELTGDGNTQLAVPSSSWSQILVYRTDLFEEHGLAPPDTYEAIEEASRVLTVDGGYGISLATDPADPFTQESFEFVGLANDCQLVDDAGEVQLDSPQCLAGFSLYSALASDYSPTGTQTVDSTRGSYFSGGAAMTIWSTFILDELAGLRNDALPTCEQCQQDPQWLAQNTGVVTAVQGPDADAPVAFGEVVSWAVMTGAKENSAAYLEYMMSDGYEASLAIAPEGKYPTRTGPSTEDAQRYLEAWSTMPAGVDTRTPLVEIYGEELLDQIEAANQDMTRWAIPQGQGRLLGPTSAELPVPRAISGLSTGATPQEVADQAAAAVEEIQRSQQ